MADGYTMVQKHEWTEEHVAFAVKRLRQFGMTEEQINEWKESVNVD